MNQVLLIGSDGGSYATALYDRDQQSFQCVQTAQALGAEVRSAAELEDWLKQHPFYGQRLLERDASFELRVASTGAELMFKDVQITLTHAVSRVEALIQGVLHCAPNALRSSAATAVLILERNALTLMTPEGNDYALRTLEYQKTSTGDAVLDLLSTASGIELRHFQTPLMRSLIERQLAADVAEARKYPQADDPEFVLMPLASFGRGVRFTLERERLTETQHTALTATLNQLEWQRSANARLVVFSQYALQASLRQNIERQLGAVSADYVGSALASLGAAMSLAPLEPNGFEFVEILLHSAQHDHLIATITCDDLRRDHDFVVETAALEYQTGHEWRSRLGVTWRLDSGFAQTVAVSRSAQFKRWRLEPDLLGDGVATRPVTLTITLQVRAGGRTVLIGVDHNGAIDAYSWQREI